MNFVNESLKNRREDLNYTSDELAKAVGISKSYYSMLETGNRPIKYEMAYKISKVLRTTPDDLFLDYETRKCELA